MRIAIISHAFPPSSHANGKRPYYLAKGFLEAGWEVDVYTSFLGCASEIVELLEDSRCRVIRVNNPVVEWQERLKSMKLLRKLLMLLSNGLLWPDSYVGWVKRVLKQVAHRDGGYDRVLGFVFPPSVYVAEKYGVVDEKWVFDLQESVSPQFQIIPRRSPVQRFMLPRLKSLEKKALHAAGRVVFTAATNRQAYVAEGLVPENRAEHVPYFYDLEVFGKGAAEVAEGFGIYYFGTFDWRGSRSPEVFLKSLAGFLEATPEARSVTKFVFYGSWLKEHDSIVESLGLRDVVSIHEAIPYEQYLETVRRAPVLLLVVAPEHNLFMPSKIVDYLGSQRPILAFVPDSSEMRGVLSKASMAEGTVESGDVRGGVAALSDLWKNYESGSLVVESGTTEFWSSTVQIKRYVDLVESLGEGSKRERIG